MKHSESIKNIAQAMREFQSNPMVVGVNATGYGYDYATLDKCVERIYPAITDLGLSIMQPLGCTDSGEPAIHTIIMHTSGEHLETVYPITAAGIGKANDAQQFGAAVTYARRYGLLAAFGVPVGKDDDAACLTEKPARPTGQKYKPEDPTPADAILEGIGNCADVAELNDYYRKHRQTIQGSPRVDEILSEMSIRKGELEEQENQKGK